DALIYRYFELATDVPTEQLPELARFAEENPRDAKHRLAHTIVRRYHGEAAADAARAHFERTVIRGEAPEDMPEVPVEGARIALLDLIRQAGFAASNGEARRFVQQGAVTLDGERADDPFAEVDL